jgi:nanoRNase/pAp phosphatase (c-di-AMP/oligoRNAs hydrolase)
MAAQITLNGPSQKAHLEQDWRMNATSKTHRKLRKLSEAFARKTYLLIVLQDNPDPDAIAAAVALRKLANSLANLQCSITYGGTVGRAENRALVKYLGLNLRACSEIDYNKFDLIGMVDTQPGTGNNSLPAECPPHIVIDHHPIRRTTRAAPFTDVRSSYGSTSTILVEYLIEAGITPDAPVATALLYGIRSDTQDLGREATRADIEAIEFLYPFANKRMLSVIQRGKVPRAYFQMLADALRNATVQGSAIVTGLGDLDNPDMIAEVADLLMRNDETTWTLCSGFWNDKLLISIRTTDENNRADKVVRRLVARKGTGGGHFTYAGGQIPVATATNVQRQRLEKHIHRRFLRIVGVQGSPGACLVRV